MWPRGHVATWVCGLLGSMALLNFVQSPSGGRLLCLSHIRQVLDARQDANIPK